MYFWQKTFSSDKNTHMRFCKGSQKLYQSLSSWSTAAIFNQCAAGIWERCHLSVEPLGGRCEPVPLPAQGAWSIVKQLMVYLDRFSALPGCLRWKRLKIAGLLCKYEVQQFLAKCKFHYKVNEEKKLIPGQEFGRNSCLYGVCMLSPWKACVDFV